jgi:hypothetical protein
MGKNVTQMYVQKILYLLFIIFLMTFSSLFTSFFILFFSPKFCEVIWTYKEALILFFKSNNYWFWFLGEIKEPSILVISK